MDGNFLAKPECPHFDAYVFDNTLNCRWCGDQITYDSHSTAVRMMLHYANRDRPLAMGVKERWVDAKEQPTASVG